MQTLNQTEPTKSRVRADFDGLLRLAEETQHLSQELSDKQSQLDTLRQWAVGLLPAELLIAYFALASVLLPRSAFHLFPSHVGVAILVFDLLIGGLTLLQVKRIRDQRRRLKGTQQTYERDLTEIVELLREIEPVVAKEEDLSVLDRVQIRIRLSRFGVGQSSREMSTSTTKDMKDDFLARKRRVDQELAKPF